MKIKLLGTFVVFLFCSCLKNSTTVEEYSKFPVKYAKTKISYPSNDFSITIPKNWKWKVEEYENDKIILGMDIIYNDSITNYLKIMSIQKYKSLENNSNLNVEFETLLSKSSKNNLSAKILESGKTKILNYDSYFIHTKFENENSVEMITFLLKSKQNGIFYTISNICQNKDDVKTTLSIMIKCAKSFEIN